MSKTIDRIGAWLIILATIYLAIRIIPALF